MALICLSALHTMRGCWIYGGFMLRVLFQPFRIILIQNYRFSLSHHWAWWRLNHQVSIRISVTKILMHCCLIYNILLFPVRELIIRYFHSPVLPWSVWWFALRAVVWKGVWEKTTHFIFRTSAMCLRMKGYWMLSWQQLSDGCICECERDEGEKKGIAQSISRPKSYHAEEWEVNGVYVSSFREIRLCYLFRPSTPQPESAKQQPQS